VAALARWCFRHRFTVLLLWLCALAGTTVGGQVVGDAYANNFRLPGSESSKALDLLVEGFPQQSGDVDVVVWKADDGSVRDAAVRRRMEPALADIAKVPEVGSVVSPYERGGAAQISADGTIGYARIVYDSLANNLDTEQIERVVDTARQAETDGLQVEVGGNAVAKTEGPAAGLTELVAIVAAAVVLFLAFGSLYAMLLPIAIAIFSVGSSLSGIALVSNVLDIPQVATTLGSLIGLGVGIDYALFIVTRHRNMIRRGRTPAQAVELALNTSGRAVLFAGATVCAALLGMYTLGMTFLNGVATAAAATVVLTMLAAITLLPALLGFLGTRVLNRRERRALAEPGSEPGSGPEDTAGAAGRLAAFVQRRPRTLALVAVAVMAVLAVPVLSLRLGIADQGNQPTSNTTRRAYDLMTDGFGPGFNGPLQLVADVPGQSARTALDTLVEDLRGTEGVSDVKAAPLRPGQRVAVIQVVSTASPQAEQTDRLIDRLRDDVIPRAEKGTPLQVYVGGATAVNKDFASMIGEKLPLFIGVIVGLGFVLLLLAFRSLLIPLTAAAMNLAAAGASFGVLVALFQWGWITGLLDLGGEVPISSFLPVIMLAMLFGLSMDYQVFLVSRIYEEWVHSGDNHRAVRVGLTETARVINSAAAIMICVFGAFVLSGSVEGKMAGIGLAAAVALDAFILRSLLVPSVMHLLGRANWWLPSWLERSLPHLAIEPPEEGKEERPAAPASAPEPAVEPERPAERAEPKELGGSR